MDLRVNLKWLLAVGLVFGLAACGGESGGR